jgi:hypothetical protein
VAGTVSPMFDGRMELLRSKTVASTRAYCVQQIVAFA